MDGLIQRAKKLSEFDGLKVTEDMEILGNVWSNRTLSDGFFQLLHLWEALDTCHSLIFQGCHDGFRQRGHRDSLIHKRNTNGIEQIENWDHWQYIKPELVKFGDMRKPRSPQFQNKLKLFVAPIHTNETKQQGHMLIPEDVEHV